MVEIQRHKTAIKRNKLSRPVQNLLDSSLLTPEHSFFDYGCGHGQDLELLSLNGFLSIAGFDPYFKNEAEFIESDVVNLGYVLNVIENPQERREALKKAFGLTKKVLCVSVMTKHQQQYEGTDFEDGVISSSGTFQKYFDQTEIKNYLESSLNCDAVAVQPGIFFIFKEEKLKLDYLEKRYRRNWLLTVNSLPRSVGFYAPRIPVLDKIKASELFPEALNFIRYYARTPEPEECKEYYRLIHEFKSAKRVNDALLSEISDDEWLDIRAQRIEHLLVFFALTYFSKSGFPLQKDIPDSLESDIKSYFKNYKEFLSHAQKLLFSLGNEKIMGEAYRSIQIGKILPDAVYVHPSYLESLPAPVQVKVGIAKALIGEMPDCNLIKISKVKSKVSFLVYENFEQSPHPALLRSYSIDIPKNHVEFIDFSKRENPPILHRKETFVGENFPGYSLFKELTESEDKAGLLSLNTIGTKLLWEKLLSDKGYVIKDHKLEATNGK